MTMNHPGISTSTPGYEIRISQEGADHERWYVESPDLLGRHSRTLVLPRGSTADAFRPGVSRITELRNGSPTGLGTNHLEYGFSRLLDLAIACWQHNCFIRNDFQVFADDDQGCYGEPEIRLDPTAQQQSVDWMFIALVFDFPSIFQKKSVNVIMKYDPKGNSMDLERYHNLPDDFRALVTEMREEMVLKTYNHVRDAWVSLVPQSAYSSDMKRMLAHFNEPHLGLDLTKPEPKRLREISPNRLLEEFEKVLEESEDGQVESQPRPSSIIRHGRGGVVSTTIFQGFRSAKASVKRRRFPKSMGTGCGEHSGLGQRQPNLLFEMNNWRNGNILVGIPLDPDSKFSSLRKEHNRSENDPQPASELETNGGHRSRN
ncbi:hypothetical protein F5882DRAFT_445958 [Hyaloscypha sp. PMI_1271]|nr:hypothetical protein F5882DRAFT_445958 [Hyaloscypha sp. PMI_1271]